jgi:hypothetical protein
MCSSPSSTVPAIERERVARLPVVATTASAIVFLSV